FFSFIGCNQNHSIGSPGSINGRRCRIFQNIYGFNIRTVQIIYIAYSDPINYIKWTGISDGSQTANGYFGSGTWLTVVSCNIDTGSNTLQSFHSRTCIQGGNILPFYIKVGTCGQGLLLYTVPNPAHFFQ